MNYNPDIHRRQSIRLKGYDYSRAGTYFVTIVTQGMTCCFGDVASDEMCLNGAGRMACRVWESLPQRFPGIEMDAFVVMPNHIHGIIIVEAQDNSVGMPLAGAQGPGIVGIPTPGATTRVAPTGGRVILGNVIGAYKSLTTVEYTRGVKTHSWSPFNGRLWQRNYYEHIVRDEESLGRIRQYIIDNPAQWMFDQENPMAGGATGRQPMITSTEADVGQAFYPGCVTSDARRSTGRTLRRTRPRRSGTGIAGTAGTAGTAGISGRITRLRNRDPAATVGDQHGKIRATELDRGVL